MKTQNSCQQSKVQQMIQQFDHPVEQKCPKSKPEKLHNHGQVAQQVDQFEFMNIVNQMNPSEQEDLFVTLTLLEAISRC